jgi:hypothetical protein
VGAAAANGHQEKDPSRMSVRLTLKNPGRTSPVRFRSRFDRHYSATVSYVAEGPDFKRVRSREHCHTRTDSLDCFDFKDDFSANDPPFVDGDLFMSRNQFTVKEIEVCKVMELLPPPRANCINSNK